MRRIDLSLQQLELRCRSVGRRGLSACLRRVPLGPLLSLRQSFVNAAEGSFKERVQRRLLEVVRHRGVPSELESFALVDNPSIRLVNADSFIVERLYWFGQAKGYEPEGIHWWRHFCKRSHNILELGTNIGYFAVHGAKANPSARYTAVEPHPRSAEICRRNLALNGVHSVDVVEAAAVSSAESPRLELHLPMGRDHYLDAPLSGFVGPNEVHREDARSYRSVTVAAVELRQLFEGVDLLKVDVEGLEFELLSSVTHDIRTRTPTMFLEVLDETPCLRAFIAGLLQSTAYECFVPTPSRLVPIPAAAILSLSVQREFGTRDVILWDRTRENMGGTERVSSGAPTGD